MGKKVKTTFKQKLLLIIFGIFILLFVEIILQVSGIIKRQNINDPFVGFEKIYPLFGEKKLPSGKTVYATNENKLSFFNYQQFEREKPDSIFRIFCFGGSTTYGRPYADPTSFPRLLEVNLNLIKKNRTFQVINAGGISYASYRIVHLVEEVTQYEPDLFVLYCGHNEFLEARTYENILQQNPTVKKIRLLLDKSDIYVLLRNAINKVKKETTPSEKSPKTLQNEVATILDASAGLDQYSRETIQKEETFEHFEYNLEKIIEIAQEQNIPLILATVTSNSKDFSPFKSEHKKTLTPANLDRWEEQYKSGIIFQNQKHYQQALIAYEKCFNIDDQYAELALELLSVCTNFSSTI